MSGCLKVTVLSKSLELQQMRMELNMNISTRRPIHPTCKTCKTRTNTLKSWNFFENPLTLLQGTHAYPFSYLFAGSLPATTSSALAMIEYELVATIQPNPQQYKAMVANRPLKLARAILPSGDKTSQRVFPPTSLTAVLIMPTVCNPGSHWMGTLAFTGVQPATPTNTQRWKLKKVNWRIDELSKVISPACKTHKSRVSGNNATAESPGGIEYSDTRIVGAGDLKEGWKADWTAHENGRIEMEVEFSTHLAAKPCCDVEDAAEGGSGIVVSHTLVIEAIVYEVVISPRGPGRWVESLPSGSARVLRMQFPVTVTERGGLGISWDNEIPPMYHDITDHHSLPAYDMNNTASAGPSSARSSTPYETIVGRNSTPAPLSNGFHHGPTSGSHSGSASGTGTSTPAGQPAPYGASHLHQINRRP
ncbi:Endocytosis regulator [Savitreella phatthalungensis]